MAADTLIDLTQKINDALDSQSDVQVDPATARALISVQLAKAINDFVIGRETQVVGVDNTGVPVTGTGTIM